jgi:arylsulfatase A-like enzyme
MPYRSVKSSAWEGGVRIPGFLHTPAYLRIPPMDYFGMVHVADWVPTLLGLAGLQGM